jgi:hypothetical protein
MPAKSILVILILLCYERGWCQLRDTVLHSMSSKPFFYNVLKGGDGKIYAGTSEGIFCFDGTTMSKVENRSGYLILDKNELPTVNPQGIKYQVQTKYSKLLPFPEEQRVTYHAGTDDFFYLAAGGKIHIYEILPFDVTYRSHSVRAASRNFVGTYSGIYYRGRRLDASHRFPGFTDGRIREINGKVFICYSSLLIADLPHGDSLPTCRLQLPKGFDFNWTSDILYSNHYKQFFLASTTDLVRMNEKLTTAESVYKVKGKDTEIVLLGENRGNIYFSSGKHLYFFNPVSNRSEIQFSLHENIMDGFVGSLSNYLLCSQGFYVVNRDGSSKKLATLNQAHTLQHLGGSEFAIATNAGLFRYNAASNKLSPLINGIEFNRRGLYLQGDSLFAGSINGLYILDARYLDDLSERVTNVNGNTSGSYKLLFGLLIALIILIGLLTKMLFRSRRKLKAIEADSGFPAAPVTTREDIERFIAENLAKASLKSITERFNTSNAYVYTVLAPEKPGALINRLRMEKVMQFRKEKKTASEISEVTGFSVLYVRKIWNNKQE